MMIGKRLNGRYKILRAIGGGGMANVFLAHDMILDRDVAVKILRLDYVNANDLMKRFQREAQSATSLTHPNIVSMYDVGDEDENYYLVMEYVEGMTLKEYIQQHSPVSLDNAVKIMSQLTSAISHAHHNGIIHRDIKPQNILVDTNGDIKITDFGIAMALSATSITQTNSVMGTVHYLSPEQARGGVATKKSDIYSLGIVMFELITGRLPFEGESAVSIALKHLQSEIPPPSKWSPNLPQSVENVILKSTAKDAFYRYATADEMLEDLKSVLDEDRYNEPKFMVEPDNDATRAIPIIRPDRNITSNTETQIRIDNTKKAAPAASPPEKTKKQDKKKKKKWPWIVLLVLFLMLAGTTAMAALGMFGPARVAVPNLVGETLADGEKILEQNGLLLGDITYQPNEEVPKDVILKTTPKATRNVDEGEAVNVVVSSGKATIELDDYTDKLYEDVQSLIQNLEFDNVRIEEVFDESAEGTIIDQSPEAGVELIPSETTLQLTLSRGEETAAVENLIGLSPQEIAEFEARTELTVNTTREEYSSELPEGAVISQDPAEGTELTIGDQVNVVVSLGERPLPVSNVVVPVEIEYLEKEEEEEAPPEEGESPPEIPGDPIPQSIQIFIEDKDNKISEPYEEFTITETTERTIPLKIEPGETGAYKVVRDGEVILENEIPYNENQ